MKSLTLFNKYSNNNNSSEQLDESYSSKNLHSSSFSHPHLTTTTTYIHAYECLTSPCFLLIVLQ